MEVGDGRDLRQRGDLPRHVDLQPVHDVVGAREPARVARAVLPLVVLVGDMRRQHPDAERVPQEEIAEHGVLLDATGLLRVERAPLAEERVVQEHPADVVEDAAHRQPPERGAVVAGEPSEHGGRRRDVQAMLEGVAVVAPERAESREHGPVQDLRDHDVHLAQQPLHRRVILEGPLEARRLEGGPDLPRRGGSQVRGLPRGQREGVQDLAGGGQPRGLRQHVLVGDVAGVRVVDPDGAPSEIPEASDVLVREDDTRSQEGVALAVVQSHAQTHTRANVVE